MIDEDWNADLGELAEGWAIAHKQAETAAEPRTGNPDNGNPDAELRSHQRIAHRFAVATEGKLLHVTDVGWHYWDGKRWAPDNAAVRAKQHLKQVLRRCWVEAQGDKEFTRDVQSSMTGFGAKGVLMLAEAAPELAAPVASMDADPWLLNCANGTLDLHTLELRPHDPRDRLTKITRAAYRPGERGEDWDYLLSSSLPDAEVRAFLQRFFGHALIGRVIEHVLGVLTGAGRNGKGAITETTQKALGDYAIATSNELLLSGRYGQSSAGEEARRMRLRGSRFVTMSEFERGSKLAEATMKRLTGGDPIEAKNMGQNPVEFEPSHTLVMLANDLPTVAADADAVWDRMLVVPFEVSFRGREDVGLKERLESQLDAVLTWAVEGLREYQRRRLDPPEAVKARTHRYREDNNPVRQFVKERCDVGSNLRVTKKAFASAYNDWARANGQPQHDQAKVGEFLRACEDVSAVRRAAGEVWVGIQLATSQGVF